jgi:hypothetical protein
MSKMQSKMMYWQVLTDKEKFLSFLYGNIAISKVVMATSILFGGMMRKMWF